jgi:hypothetical protein
MTKIFGATSTTQEVLSGVNLRGKRILVTGVSAGLGVETARSLAAHGAQGAGTLPPTVEASSWRHSIWAILEASACADALVAKGEPFEVILANAGVLGTPFGHTADGLRLSSAPIIWATLCSLIELHRSSVRAVE